MSISQIILGCLVFWVSVGLTWWVLGWLRRKAILDVANERSSHAIATPRGGGLALTTSIVLGWIGLALLDLNWVPPIWIIIAFVGLGLLSWVDDLKGLGARVRLPAHIVACVLGLWALEAAGAQLPLILPYWIEFALIVLIWAGFVNFFNFMDGIDGISGAEAIGIALGVILLPVIFVGVPAQPSAVIVVAAAAGFLIWNWPPAKLFMGDVGSIPLGYLLGSLLLSLALQGYWAAALILPLYYLSDAGLTLLKRAMRFEKIWQAHREHFYQRAVQGLEHGEGAAPLDRSAAHLSVTVRIGVTNIGLIGCAILSVHWPLPALVVAFLLVGGLLWWMATAARYSRAHELS